MSARISIDQEKLAEFCRRRHIRKLSLFGSVARAAHRRLSHCHSHNPAERTTESTRQVTTGK